jgi:hypothetical protein
MPGPLRLLPARALLGALALAFCAAPAATAQKAAPRPAAAAPDRAPAPLGASLSATARLGVDAGARAATPARRPAAVTAPKPAGGAPAPAPAGLGGVLNDFHLASAPIFAGESVYTGTNRGADVEGGFNPSASCTVGGPDNDGDNAVWWIFKATAAGTVVLDLQGSGFDTILSVILVGPDAEVACNDDDADEPGDLTSRVSFEAEAGRQYQVRVTGYQGDEGSIRLAVAAAGVVTGPPNDSVTQGVLLFVPNGLYTDTNVGATEEPGIPLASCVAAVHDGRNSVWRGFFAAQTGTATISTAGSSFDTVLSAYDTGLQELACNDDAGGTTLQSRVSFPVTQGQQYVVRVVGYDGAAGDLLYDFHVGPPQFFVTSPAPLDVYLPGSQVRIRWEDPAALGGNVRIEIVDANGAVVRTTHANTSNTGSKNTTLNGATPPGDGYRFRVTHLGGAPFGEPRSLLGGESAPFAVLDPAFAIAVAVPAEGARIPLGTSGPVEWASPPALPAGSMVSLWLVCGSNPDLRLRLRREANDGRASVRFPAAVPPADDYRLELVAESDARYWGRSAPFSLGAFPTLTVDRPEAGEAWPAGSAQPVAWWAESLDPAGTITIYLLRPGQPRIRIYRGAQGEESGGSVFFWTVPADLVPGPGYRMLWVYDDGETRLTKKSGLFTITPPSGAAALAGDAPVVLTLEGARPNPVAGAAVVRYGLPSAGAVRVAVYDALGREVAVLAEGEEEAGWHEAALSAGALAPGVYVVRVTAGSEARVERLTVVR